MLRRARPSSHISIRQRFSIPAIALGFIMGAAAATGAFYWWHKGASTMPAPWNTSAIEAKFWKSVKEDSTSTWIFYTLRNSTATDYTLTSESSAALFMIGPGGSLVNIPAPLLNHVRLAFPLFVPARRQVTCGVLELNGADKQAIARINGFKIFDQKNRYEILLPRGW